MHLNDLNLFDLEYFTQDTNLPIICTKIELKENVPSTRWGHAAVCHDNMLYILGGRNDQDINDIHCFDL